MKPDFALSLSFVGIRLLHRAAGGWHMVGDVSVSSADLSGDLAALRAAGDAIATGPLRTKVIIPDEQIRYLSINTPGMDDDARRAAAYAALEGATPYPVDALAFDISPDGDVTHVATVAHETLLEAENFAIEHRFDPVSFVAAAEESDFLGEPFFGPTAHAGKILGSGETVEPDGVRVVIVAQPATEPDDVPKTETETAPLISRIKRRQADAAPQQRPAEQPAKAKADDAAADVAPAPARSAPKTPPLTPARQSPPKSAPVDEDAVTVPPGKASPSKPSPPSKPPPKPVPPAAAAGPADESDTEVTTPPLLGFATRRRQDPSSSAEPARLGGATRASRTQPPVTPPAPPAAKTIPTLTAPPKSAADSLRPTPVLSKPEPAIPTAPPAPEAAPKTRAGGFLSRRKHPKGPDDAAAKSASRGRKTSKQVTPGDLETERMTIFGARGDGAIGGKPRFLGLILTAILIVFLAAVAAWATVFLDDGLARLFPSRERTLASTLPEDARATLADDVGVTTHVEPDAEETEEGVVVAALNDSLSEDGLSAEDAAVLDALRDPLPDPIAPEELDAAALEARYAVTGIWPKAPEQQIPTVVVDIDDLYVTGIDPVSPALDAVALPSVASLQTDRQLALVTSPVAAGTDFARGLDGRVIPTPEGALSPDGFTVFLGRPPVVPPATFVRLETEPEVAPQVSALAQVRPRTRPGDLVEQNERAALGGLSRSELADFRPRLRPQAPQDVPQPEQEDTQVQVEPSALAAATSLRPTTRPRNFSRIVTRAQRNAPEAAPERVASVAPRTVAPAIPSTASVAREATVRNALNLRKVNLIGVYGTPSNRRALVRLSNGRYRKVEVGDRFDGGRVSAIGDSELRYQKSGRNVVLKMPQG